jgi:hypothetical protein
MGYGGKHVERAKARELRAHAWTLIEIANGSGVSKASGVGLGERRRVSAHEPRASRGPDPSRAVHEAVSSRSRQLDTACQAHRWMSKVRYLDASVKRRVIVMIGAVTCRIADPG